jgi:hypothetical protein
MKRPWWVRLGRVCAVVVLALGVACAATAATERPGAGASMGVGAAIYAPSPSIGFRVDLPALEVAAVPQDGAQLRLRSPLLETIYNAALRHQFLLIVDAFVLFSPGPPNANIGKAVVRPRIGPMFGVRIQGGHSTFQPGLRVGGRFGGEVMGPGRRTGLFFGFEPRMEFMGGAAGVGRTSATFGGGAVFTIAVTGYAKP